MFILSPHLFNLYNEMVVRAAEEFVGEQDINNIKCAPDIVFIVERPDINQNILIIVKMQLMTIF